MNVGIKAKPPDLLNSTHEKDQVTQHPWNLLRGLTHLPLPFPHPFLNTYHLLKNTTGKNSNRPKRGRGGEILREGGFPPPRTLGPSYISPYSWPAGPGGGRGTKLCSAERAQGGGWRDRARRGGDRQDGEEKENRGKSGGKEVQGGMKEQWAALGRLDRGNRPGRR